MRLRGRQGRFVATTIGGWICLRLWALWPAAPIALGGALLTAGANDREPAAPIPMPMEVFRPAPPLAVARDARSASAAQPPQTFGSDRAAAGRQMLLVPGDSSAISLQRHPDRASFATPATAADVAPSPPPPATAPRVAQRRTIEGSAYLFVRPGSGSAALAPGGSLGGSQAAARIAIALQRDGPVRSAIAARLYAPLATRGAEAAIGFDWHPLPGRPVRLSIERRIGLDRAGRDAWSAYAAGGFYAAGPIGSEIDGYGQAGVVGAQRRDLFADGALRAGKRIGPVLLGAGMWGAAQPGAARLDAGPRVSLSVPVDAHRLTIALEGRFRIAGRAAPGSGAALTIAADF